MHQILLVPVPARLGGPLHRLADLVPIRVILIDKPDRPFTRSLCRSNKRLPHKRGIFESRPLPTHP